MIRVSLAVNELHVSLLVICLQSTQTLLCKPLDTFLFLFLSCRVESEYCPAQSHDSLSGNTIRGEKFLAVVAYGIEPLNMLVFSLLFAFKSLFPFNLFRHAMGGIELSQSGGMSALHVMTAVKPWSDWL